MNRNVVIVITILVLAIIAGYLVWLRSRLAPEFNTQIQSVDQLSQSPLPDVSLSPVPTPTIASPSAQATPAKSASPSATPRR